jgi:methyl-accepting chemotaxis protein
MKSKMIIAIIAIVILFSQLVLNILFVRNCIQGNIDLIKECKVLTESIVRLKNTIDNSTKDIDSIKKIIERLSEQDINSIKKTIERLNEQARIIVDTLDSLKEITGDDENGN